MPDQNAVTRLNAALEGRYRVERQLGEGGMATVYLADDLRHERKVALKVLKPELAAVVGAERFLAEIKTTANLQHPHILPLFDSGEAGSFLFYVMPYVEGESLRERLDREHQLPVDDAVRIASDVAEALDYAHRHGVIHRDIKPANILLQDGRPVVSDFGIALALGVAGAGRLTETGLSLGTPHYMSPEQATGDVSVGAATDIYALGCVLYEMLVGEPPYTGSTPQAVLGKIIQARQVSATEARRTVPAHVDAVIRRALEKVPADRFTGARELAKALSDPGFRHGAIADGLDGDGEGRAASSWRRSVPWGVAAVSLAVAVLAIVRPSPQDRVGVVRFTIGVTPPDDTAADSLPPFRRSSVRNLAISPDGESLVFQLQDASHRQLYTRRLDQETPLAMPGTEGANAPTFSPDGAWVAFVDLDVGESADNAQVKRVSMTDGHVETIGAAPTTDAPGVTWGDDGTIVVGGRRGLYRAPATGGVWDTLATADSTEFELYGQPWMLPGSHTVLLHVRHSYDPADAEIVALDLATRTQKTLLSDAMSPIYVPTGHLLFMREGTLMAVRFDPDRLELRGQPVAMVDDIMQSIYAPNSGAETGAAQVAVSASGHLVYAAGGAWPERPRIVERITTEGDTVPLLDDGRAYGTFRVSPDGTRVALESLHGQQDAIWIHDLRLQVTTRLNTGGAFTSWPMEWSPDGQSILFSSSIDGPIMSLYRVPADGSAAPERLTEPGRQSHLIESVSPDGTVAFESDGGIWVLPPGGSPAPFVTSQDTREMYAVFSPDGRWLAYTAGQTGTQEVYVRPYPGPGTATLITNGGGTNLAWSRDGRRLYFVRDRVLMSVDVTPGEEFVVGRPTPVLDPFTYSQFPVRGYDVFPDGSFILGVPSKEEDLSAARGVRELHVVLNFFDDLRARLPD